MPGDPGILAATLAAPWGPIHVAASDRGIVAVELLTTREAFADGLQRRLGRPVRWLEPGEGAANEAHAAAGGHLRAAIESVDAATRIATGDVAEGFRRAGDAATRIATGGGADALTRLPLDLEDRPAWDRAVLDAVRAIPRGETRSYGEIARAIGRPGAARAVGGAVGRNPISLLIPCHRVIAGDGTLGGYGGDAWGSRDERLALKRELLLREGITVRNRGG
ncbi:MAG TPA: MGMT family protein [Candidatus Sulfomarinibacteraceae bacterium]|nr:MGMT family protein [Candidatus Sulfomarinibacteraceae bacterium]